MSSRGGEAIDEQLIYDVIQATRAHRCIGSTLAPWLHCVRQGQGAPGRRCSPLRLVDQPHEMWLLGLPHAEAPAPDVGWRGG